MPKISEAHLREAYSIAKRVYEDGMPQADARSYSADLGMNPGSAQAYIRNFRHMLAGKWYRRTMNEAGTLLFL